MCGRRSGSRSELYLTFSRHLPILPYLPSRRILFGHSRLFNTRPPSPFPADANLVQKN